MNLSDVISAERLDKIISETERYIAARPHKSRHNASTEVNAALFLSILNELKERRQATQKSIEAQRLSLSYTADLENRLEDALEELKRLAVIMTGSDAPGEIRALTVTARSLVDRCKTLAAEVYDLKHPGTYLPSKRDTPALDAFLSEIARTSTAAKPVAINDDMAYAFHRALSDSSLSADEVEEIKVGLRAAFANIATTPAPIASDSECHGPLMPFSFVGAPPNKSGGWKMLVCEVPLELKDTPIWIRATPFAPVLPDEVIPLIESLKPEYGAPGSRDVDVTAKRDAVDAIIKLLCGRKE